MRRIGDNTMSGFGNYSQPGFDHGRQVAIAARAQSGEWIDLATARSRGAANDKAHQIRKRPSIAFRPVGAFEARTEKRADGYAVLVRYIGEKPP